MKLFVWDFHGVLEKGNEHAVLIVTNEILRRSGYFQRLNPKDNEKLYGLKWHEYFQYLLPQEPRRMHLQLEKMCIEYGLENPKIIKQHIKQNDNASSVLDTIENMHHQILISNTTPSSMEIFLNSISLKNYFSNGNLFAIGDHPYFQTKKDALSHFLEGKNYEEIIIIGDTQKDIDLKKVRGGISYLYSHPSKEFRGEGADYLIHDLREILKEI